MKKRCCGCGRVVNTDKTAHAYQGGIPVRNNDVGGSWSFPTLVYCGELVLVVKHKGKYVEAEQRDKEGGVMTDIRDTTLIRLEG